MSCPAVVKISVPGGPAVARVVTPGPKGLKGDPGLPGDPGEPGASYYYQPRETVTAVGDVYTLDVTVAKEFVTAAAINGPATFNLSELNQIPADEVWRGVLRAGYTSGMVDLGILGGSSSYANSVSADGSFVAGNAITGAGEQHAFRWTESSGMVDLGTLGGGSSYGGGISADGSVVVGEAQTASGEYRAFRWTEAGGMQDLGTLGGSNWSNSYAYNVSADGSVVVGEAQIASGEYRAFLWTEATGMVSLGTFGGTYSGAYGISADGSTVVGQANLPDENGRAFIWKPINWFPANVADSYTINWASGQPFIPNAGDEIALLIEAVGDENIIRVSQFYGEQDLPPVQSVNGKTGNVILKKEDIGGLQNVDNTSDANKPISTATQAALDGKVDTTDNRLSDARTPNAHKISHATGGSDELTPGDIGAEPAGAAATAVSSHEAAADPHPGYVQQSDSRLALADSAVQPADLATVATSGAYGDLSGLPTLGTAAPLNVAATGNASAAQVVKGDDSRLSDARTPTAHTQPASTISGLATVATSGAYSDLSGRFDPASPGAIGGTTPAAGTFTSLSANSRLNLPSGAPVSPAARDVYAVANTLRYRDSTGAERLLLNATDNLANLADASVARTNLGAEAYYPIRQTLTAVSGTYTLDVTSGKEFTTSAAINGTTTINLSGLASIPTNGVWRGVLRLAYTSGAISWFTGNSGYTIKWDGGLVMTPTAGETEAVIIEVVGGSTTIEVAALRGRT